MLRLNSPAGRVWLTLVSSALCLLLLPSPCFPHPSFFPSLPHPPLFLSFLSLFTGLAATNDTDNAELFSIVDATGDAWFQIYAAIFHEKDEKRKVAV